MAEKHVTEDVNRSGAADAAPASDAEVRRKIEEAMSRATSRLLDDIDANATAADYDRVGCGHDRA